MKGIFILFSGILMILFSCQQPADNEESAAKSDPIDFSAMDTSIRPQNNFFLYANGTWLKNTQIPASQFSWGSFSTLQDSSIVRLHGILDSVSKLSSAAPDSIAQQTGDLYLSGMDSAGIEKKGFDPVKPELDSIEHIKNYADLMNVVAASHAVNHAPFFSFTVGADDKNSMVNIAHFNQGGLGLPTRDYYFKNDTATKRVRNGYLSYISRIFTLIGSQPAEADKKANSVMQLETELAKVSRNQVALRDPIANYHKESVTSLNKSLPGFKDFLHSLGVPSDSVLMGQPEFYKRLFSVLHKTPIQTLKNYLCFHVLNDDADYLSHDFVDTKFDYTRLLTGQSQMKERWKRMTSLVDGQLGDALGQLYVQKYFPPEAKQKISDLVDNIISTYAERLQQLNWMSDSTRQKAVQKLHAIVKKIGYPDKWKDYSSIHIVRDDIIANLKATANYRYKRDINKIGKPVDRMEWSMTPPTINAYYEPTQNNINFPAGILQPPFYFVSGDDAVNYGGIGLVIGHEITHGFDDQGRQYDADGNLKEWWTPEDVKRFKQRAQKIIDQYNGYIAIDTFHLNGELTEGENIADNGGIAIAYAAFKKTAQGKADEKINGLTPDQRFFLSFAQIWKTKIRPERLRTLTLTNEHSAPMWRVNGSASNTPAFYTAFQVKPEDPMFRPDSLRVKIW